MVRGESGGGPPQSKTLCVREGCRILRQLLVCASPLALFRGSRRSGNLDWTTDDGGSNVGRVTGISGGEKMSQRIIQPTAILDYDSSIVRRFAESIHVDDASKLNFLRAAHLAVSERVKPVYTVKEFQPVSKTLALGRGSCSQRLACLKALARLKGISTRDRALWVAGKFWNKRFPLTRAFIPKRILLAWPQFYSDSKWLGLEEIFGQMEELAGRSAGFTNDSETLFEAVRATAVDFEGKTRVCSPNCDLSQFVEATDGLFEARDDLFESLGAFEKTWRGRAFEL